MLWPSDEGCWGVVVLSIYKARLSEVVVNEIPPMKDFSIAGS